MRKIAGTAILFIFLWLSPSFCLAFIQITLDLPAVTNKKPLLKAYFSESVSKAWYSLDSGADTVICHDCANIQVNLNNESPQSTQGLVGWWHLDSVNATNSTPESSGNANDGTLKDGNSNNADGKTLPQLVDGRFGSALQFDGTDDYVDAGNKSSLNFLNSTHAITIEAWIYPTNYTGHNSNQWYIVSKLSYPSKGWWFLLKNGGNLSFISCDGTCHEAVSSEAIPLNQWSYVVGWSNGTTNKVFINGVEKASAKSGTLIDADAINLKMDASSADFSFKGMLDEMRLYSRALSADEIKSNYFLKTGAHSVTVYTQDNTGNIDSKSATFTVDDQAPQITFNSPVNQVVHSSDIPIDITFNEPATGVYGIFNGLKINLTHNSSNPLKYHALRKDQLGNISATIYACDSLGNCGSTPFWVYASPDAWMHSTYDDFSPGSFTNTVLSSDGIITLNRKNLLDNPSFEMDDLGEKSRWFGTDGLADPWALWGTGYGPYSLQSRPSLVLDSTTGKYSQRIDFAPASSATLYLSQSVKSASPGQIYTFSADAKIDNPSNLDLAVMLEFWKTGNSNSKLKTAQSNWAHPASFIRLSVSSQAPAGTNLIKVIVVLQPKSAGAGGTLWVDSVQLEEASAPTAFTYGYENQNGEYVSPPIDMGSMTTPYKLEWISSVPYGGVNFKVRAADTLANLQSAQWLGPTSASDSYSCISAGPNLLSNPSLETNSNNDGVPDYTKKASYGADTPIFSYVGDAHEGSKAVKVEYPIYSGSGNSGARWQILYDGALEKDSQYMFSLWHKENKDMGYLPLAVTAEYSDGTKDWNFSSDFISTSPNWKQDRVIFRIPSQKTITKLGLMLTLSRSAGYVISDSYSLQKIDYLCEKKINPVHANTRYLQYKATLSTTDPQFTPSLYDVTLRYGKGLPEIKWINVLDSQGLQKYAFYPGETATINPQILDFKGTSNIKSVKMTVYDASGSIIADNIPLSRGQVISDTEQYYAASYAIPTGASGILTFKITAESFDGRSGSETITLRIKEQGQISLQNSMPIGVINQYGFNDYKTVSSDEIDFLAKYQGVEIWKLDPYWNFFENKRGVLDTAVTDAMLAFMDGAQAHGAKVQIAIPQQNFPTWVNNGDSDSEERYDYDKTKRLMDTWIKLATIVKDHPAFDSYEIIAEENHIYDADVYLRSIEKVAAAIRSVDPKHRIIIRANSSDSYLRTRIEQGGTQNVDYGTNVYPTSASWFNPSYESPISDTSFISLAKTRTSPLVYGGRESIGELGFYKRERVDKFGDDEKLVGFERALKMAYDQGMDEFMIWGGGFTFVDPQAYFPKLREFRDAVVKQPRKTEFDVRILIDNRNFLYTYVRSTGHFKLDTAKEPYYHLMKYLDENGYSWFFTHENAAPLQNVNFKTTIKLSEIKGKSEAEQNALILSRLAGVNSSGSRFMWVGSTDYGHSMTGMDNPYDISFPDGCSQCDVFALEPLKLRIYAEKNTSVNLKFPGSLSGISINAETVAFSKLASGAVNFKTSGSTRTNDVLLSGYLKTSSSLDVNHDGTVDISDIRQVAGGM